MTLQKYFLGIKNSPLLQTLRNLVSDSAIYLVGGLFVGLTNFILVPLYTRNLSPDKFGLYSLIEITILILVTISQLGLGVAYLKWYAESTQDERASLLGSTIAVGLIASLIAGLCIYFFLQSSAGKNLFAYDTSNIAIVVALIIVSENIFFLLLTNLRASRDAILYSATIVIRLLVIVSASYYLIVIQKQEVQGVFTGRLTGDIVAVFVLGIISFMKLTPKFSLRAATPMVRYGLPIVLSALIGILLDGTGRYFLNHFSSLEEVGYYGLSVKISSIFLMLLTQPFGIAWGGVMFQINKWSNAKLIYSKILNYLFVVAALLALAITQISPTLFNFFAPESYLPALSLIPMVLLVRAINIMEYPTSIGIYLTNRTGWFTVIYLAGFGVNLTANFFMVPMLGATGAMIAWGLSWLVIVISLFAFGNRFYPLGLEWKAILIPIFLWGIFLFIDYVIFDGLINMSFLQQILMAMLCILAGGAFVFADLIRSTRSYIEPNLTVHT